MMRGISPAACVIMFAGFCLATQNIEQETLSDGQVAGIGSNKDAFGPAFEPGTYQFDTKYDNYFVNRKCPLCDTSVLPYCGDRLLHDACCCSDPNYEYDLPFECKLADCRFLHANSCREHRLIARCCCTDDYKSLLKSFHSSNN